MKNHAIIIFPIHLFEDHPAFDKASKVYLVELERYFTDFKFHQQKLILHRASMKAYEAFLEKKGFEVIYVPFNEASELFARLKKDGIATIHYADPVDHTLQHYFAAQAKAHKITQVIYDSPQFLSPKDWIDQVLGDKEHYLMAHFYSEQRKRLNILMKNGKPVGGKWSFDAENRKPLPKNVQVEGLPQLTHNKYVKEAQEYVKKHFSKNPGSAENFIYPVTISESKKWFDDFLEHRLSLFGDYQDAIKQDEPFLFHAILTPMLNIGLLTPAYVVEKTLAYANEHKTPLNALEGFIRQIIGWREFVRAVYILNGEKQRKGNFFENKRKLPYSFWEGTTGIKPIDSTIEKAKLYAYAHHIERLMILGNWMFLCQYNPQDIYVWFMELFIDSYDWVMVPNVFGMSQYADGGLMTTKPYFSSSKYVLRMSDYKKGNWCLLWDSLYWRFIVVNRDKLKSPRLAAVQMYLRRLSPEKLKEHVDRANKYLSTLNQGSSSK